MSVDLLNLYNEMDELKGNSYGDEFFEVLYNFFLEKKLSESEIKNLLECLLEIDESREIFSSEIKKVLYHCIDNNVEIGEVILLLQLNNQKYNNSQMYYKYFCALCNDFIENRISFEKVLDNIREVK